MLKNIFCEFCNKMTFHVSYSSSLKIARCFVDFSEKLFNFVAKLIETIF